MGVGCNQSMGLVNCLRDVDIWASACAHVCGLLALGKVQLSVKKILRCVPLVLFEFQCTPEQCVETQLLPSGM